MASVKRKAEETQTGRLSEQDKFQKLADGSRAGTEEVVIDEDPEISFKMSETEDAQEKATRPITNEAMLMILKQHITSANADMKGEINGSIKQLLRPINEQIGINSAEISKNARAISDIQQSLKHISNAHNGPSTSSRADVRNDDQERRMGAWDETRKRENYDISRRSVRIWPVDGESEDELRTAAEVFLLDTLLVEKSTLEQMPKIRIRRTIVPGRTKIKNEVLLTFNNKYNRDKICSHAKNLASKTSEDGSPTAGLRLDYPEHLAKDFRALEAYGAYLRRTRGKEMKRNYRFNDDDESIYMDIRLPNDTEWLRITAEMAREQNKRKNATSNNNIRRRIAETSPSSSNLMNQRMGLTRGRNGAFGNGAVVSLFSQDNEPDIESQGNGRE